ncbi:MAG TPA: pilus assembly protein PilM [Candidatus Paceibacterota bacterium]
MDKWVAALGAVVQRINALRGDSVLGIDIGSSSIKIVELRSGSPKPILETYGIIELASYEQHTPKEGLHADMDKRGQAILDLLHEVGASASSAGMSLPLSKVFISLIDTLKRDEKQLQRIIQTEAKRYIPVPIETVTLVWQIIREPESGSAFTHAEKKQVESPSMHKIILVATRNETLDEYQKIANDAHLYVPFYEAEVFSALRSLPQMRGAPFLIMDIGISGSKIYIADDQGNAIDTHYLETISTGGRASSETIVRLAEAASRMVHTYNTAHPGSIAMCVLAGGGALVPEMAPYMTHALQLPVKRADPFAEVRTPMILEDVLRDVGPLYTVACGLALRALSENGSVIEKMRTYFAR